MTSDVYKSLALALDKLPNGYPATDSGVELEILRKLCTPEEAALAACLCSTRENAEQIAAKAGLAEQLVHKRLAPLVSRGLVWYSAKSAEPMYRLAPFVIGFFEEQWKTMDHELAHLFDRYWDEGATAGIMKYEPALTRPVPARASISPELVLPYDDVKLLMSSATSFELRDCVCRRTKDLAHTRKCDFPLDTCVTFSVAERPVTSHTIDTERALAILDNAEKIGLVHMVNNVANGVFFVCNCCGCCCVVLGGVARFGIKGSVARANYFAVVDEDACVGCGICADRCQVHACTVVDGMAKIDRESCIGCGICVTGCLDKAVQLERKPDAEIIPPPDDQKAWERLKLKNRGLA